MEKDYSIAELKEQAEKYGMAFLTDDELIYLITGKKKPNKFVLDAMAEYKNRHRTDWNAITNPLSLVPFIAYLSTEQFEKFGIACLDGSRKLISSEILFSGSPNKAMVDMPSVLRHALLKNARAVIAYFGLSIILVSVIALISETCIGYVNLFGSELFNNILIGLTIDLTISGLLSRHRLLKSSHAKIND